ncbi:MAG: catalase family peroxidase [Methylophilaceae bacterium]|nr:catalase family peroxidase [Methylophilaceae bacterium]
MQKTQSRVIVTSLLLLSFTTLTWADNQSSKSVVEQIVDAQTTLAKGPYKGLRANHTKGIVVTGSFTPAASAASLTKAAHLQSTPSKVTVRFSNAGGMPTIEDTNPGANPRGIAIRFELPDGTITDIVSFSVNAFPVSTPEAFLQFLNARIATKPDSPKPTPVEKMIAETPSLQRFIAIPKPLPVSFASHSYFGVNAFEFTNAKNEKYHVRYQIVPVNGQELLNADQVAQAGPNYLFEELPQRLKTGEAKFRLLAQVAAKDDVINDPTVVWPDDRKLVELGVLSLQAPVADNAAAEKALAFNPLILVDGIAPTNDPVLLARPGAYAVSVGRKLAP